MHPARGEPIELRVAYLTVVASLAVADRSLEDAEAADIEALARDLEVPPDQVAQVLVQARAGDHSPVIESLRTLRMSNLRYTVLTDMVVLGFADGRYSMDERKRVRSYAQVMGVTEDQVVAIEQKVIQRTQEREAIAHVVEAYGEKNQEWPLWAQAIPLLLAAIAPVVLLFSAREPGPIDVANINQALITIGFNAGPVAGFFIILLTASLVWIAAAAAVSRAIDKPIPGFTR